MINVFGRTRPPPFTWKGKGAIRYSISRARGLCDFWNHAGFSVHVAGSIPESYRMPFFCVSVPLSPRTVVSRETRAWVVDRMEIGTMIHSDVARSQSSDFSSFFFVFLFFRFVRPHGPMKTPARRPRVGRSTPTDRVS